MMQLYGNLSLILSLSFLAPLTLAFSKDPTNAAIMSLKNSPARNRFVTNRMCPYAQKVWIALEASNTPYEMQEISLYGANGKPDWFRKLNPAGTVPVLVINEGEMVLRDSDQILDHYEKTEMGSISLYSESDAPRIKQWRSLLNDRLIPVGKDSVLSGRRMTKDLKASLSELESLFVGPYVIGDHVTTADCHAFPFLWRLKDEYGLDECPKLTKWIDMCSEKRPFKCTIQSSWWWWW